MNFPLMRPLHLRKILLFLLMVATFLDPIAADARTSKRGYVPRNAYYIIEAETGMVLAQHDADATLYPASLTKLMTLLLTFEALSSGKITPRSRIVMSSHAASMPPSKIGLKPGQSLSVDQAIKALVTKSANDVAVAVGETLGGSEGRFAQLMSLKAREIGMTQTHFVNASGLHNSRQVSSARDMAKLGRYILKNYPSYYSYFSLREFTYGGKKMQNHNHLMSKYQGMDGMKTGYIAASGFNLVASAKRNGVRLIGVVFGGSSANARNAQMAKLLDQGFLRIRNQGLPTPPQTQLVEKSKPIEIQPSPLANAKAISVSVPHPPRKPAHLGGSNPQPILKNPTVMTEIVKVSTPTPGMNVPKEKLPAGYIPVEEIKVPDQTTQVLTIEAPSASPPATGTDLGWSIQIGAFQDQASTDTAITNALQKLPSPLNKGRANIVPLKTSANIWVYRARLSGYTREQAIEACHFLQDCLTIPPHTN